MPITISSSLTSPATASATILARSVSQTAPEIVQVKVDVSGTDFTFKDDADIHRHHVSWDTGVDYNLSSVPAVTSTSKGNARYVKGAKAALLFPTAGTYNVGITVREVGTDHRPTGKFATGTVQIVVGNADTAYPTTNTIVVSTSGTFTGKPTGATEVTSSDLTSVFNTHVVDQTTPKRIMLRTGESFTTTGLNINCGDFIIETYGGTTPANLSVTGQFSFANSTTAASYSRDFRMNNVNVTGPFNSNTMTGSEFDWINVIWPSSPMNMVHFHKTDAIGFARHVYFESNSGDLDTHFAVSDSEWTDFRNSIFYAFKLKTVTAIGVKMGARADARVYPGSGNEGFPWRTDCDVTFIDKCDSLTKQGWTGNSSGRTAFQENFRIDSSGRVGSEHYVMDTIMRGGFGCMKIGTETGDGPPQPMTSFLIEGCTFAGSYETGAFIRAWQTPLLIRNNIFATADSTTQVAGASSVLELDNNNGDGNGNATNLAGSVRVYSNTLFNPRTSSMVWIDDNQDGGTFSNTEEDNNLKYEANTTPANTSDGAIVLAGAIFDTTMEGYRDSSGTLETSTATPADVIQSFRPQSGAGAEGDDDTGALAYSDYDGTTRGSPADRGALEVS